ncbi:MAG: metallophosphoesterase [Tepidisphaeraceae bacterium]
MHWIIGDIHGMYLPLVTLLDEIYLRDDSPRVIFCGDYVNRGPDSRRVVDLLLSLEDARFCRGNHDDAFDFLLSGTCFAPPSANPSQVTTFEHFLKYGLDQTLHSYGVDDRRLNEARRAGTTEAMNAVLEAVPETHRQFFHTLPVVQTGHDFFVAHAKWDVDVDPGVPSFATQLALSYKLRHDIIWGRYTQDEVDADKGWRRQGFFGHTPVMTYPGYETAVPLRGPNVTLLDTGAAVSIEGRLTGWCVEEERCVQAERDGDLTL